LWSAPGATWPCYATARGLRENHRIGLVGDLSETSIEQLHTAKQNAR